MQGLWTKERLEISYGRDLKLSFEEWLKKYFSLEREGVYYFLLLL